MRQRTLKLLLAALVLVSSSGCDPEVQAAKAGRTASLASAKQRPLVRVVPAAMQKINRSIELSGNILQSRKATIATSVPGTILQVHKQEGDLVRKGERLVELDQADFKLIKQQAEAGLRAARAGAAAAKTGLQNLEVQYHRFLGLREKNAVSQAEFEKVETGYRATLSQVEAAMAQEQLAEIGLQTAKKKLSDTVARAPFGGVVTQRMMDPGERITVMPPAIVMVIMDIDPVKAEGSVAERDAPAVHKGAPVEVTVDALPGRLFTGNVEAVVPFVNPATRTAKVRVHIPNPERILTPGMSATLRISLAEQELVVVPREAIVSRAGGSASVFVLDGQDQAQRRNVELDASIQGPQAAVLAGLRVGDRVVVAGLAELADGQQVRLSESRTEPAPGEADATKKASNEAAPKTTGAGK